MRSEYGRSQASPASSSWGFACFYVPYQPSPFSASRSVCGMNTMSFASMAVGESPAWSERIPSMIMRFWLTSCSDMIFSLFANGIQRNVSRKDTQNRCNERRSDRVTELVDIIQVAECRDQTDNRAQNAQLGAYVPACVNIERPSA